MFYVYELRDENATPFYVGKGSGKRLMAHEQKAKTGDMSHRACKIRQIWARSGCVVRVIVFETLFEEMAFAEEIRLIAKYGRDSLTNKTDGGDGPSNPTRDVREKIAAGRRGRVASTETRAKQRAAKLGIPRSAETKAKIAAFQRGSKHPWAALPRSAETRRALAVFTGKKHTPETIAKMKATKLGHEVSAETRAKISQSKKGSTPWNKKHTA